MLTDVSKQLPIVVTNNTGDNKKIKKHFQGILNNKYIDTIIVADPYISSYFINIIKQTPIKSVLILVDEDSPKYTMKAIEDLYDLRNPPYNKEIIAKIRPKSSDFMHMKLLMPFFKDLSLPKNNRFFCNYVFVGSVNFTKRGIEQNDEILVILRDNENINECYNAFKNLWEESKIIDTF